MGTEGRFSRKRGRLEQDSGFLPKKLALETEEKGLAAIECVKVPVSKFIEDQLGNRYSDCHLSPFEVKKAKLESLDSFFSKGTFSMGQVLS